MEVVDQLDGILFDDYIKRKTVAVSRFVTDGILYGGIDWGAAPRPTSKSGAKKKRDTCMAQGT
jgi:exocyst complex component 2